jgi:predicted CXXCH cytochrome family protein
MIPWIEWCLVGVLLVAALIPIGRRARSRTGWLLVVLAATTVGAGAVFWQARLERKVVSRQKMIEKSPREDRRDGYVKAETCQACHPAQYASWHRSFHRTMTQFATPEAVRGNFSNVTLRLPGETFHLTREGDEYYVEMVDPDWRYVQMLKWVAFNRGAGSRPPMEENPPRAKSRVGMLTGSHHMQAYWLPSAYGNMQFSLPFTYLFAEQRWVPRNDVFLLKPGSAHLQQVWNNNCLNCHATAGQPRQDPKTHVNDTRVAELGISCEACHGPGEEHVRANSALLRRYAQHRGPNPDPTIVNPSRLDHRKSSDTCGQCHAIRHRPKQDDWNLHGLPFRPGGDLEGCAPRVIYDGTGLDIPGNEKKRDLMEGCYWPDGQTRVSGRDFSALADSGCFQRGQISCLSCHSMHQYADTDDQLKPGMQGNQACVQCHQDYAGRLEQHTHHQTGSTGSLCYNCHMPHTTYGLLKGIRSHTINSPTVASDVNAGRPNACNLCHLDRSLSWTAGKLHEWYRIPPRALTTDQQTLAASVHGTLVGDAGQRVLWAWHMGWNPALEISGTNWIAPYLAHALTDSYSVVRYNAGRSLRRQAGFEQFDYDFIGSNDHLSQARERAIGIWRSRQTNTGPAHPSALIEAGGRLNEAKLQYLLQQRNDRPMELLE